MTATFYHAPCTTSTCFWAASSHSRWRCHSQLPEVHGSAMYWNSQEGCRYQTGSTVQQMKCVDIMPTVLKMHNTLCIGHTRKALLLASTATATGPAVATAASRSDSLPLGILTLPEIRAPALFLLKVHDDCWVDEQMCRDELKLPQTYNYIIHYWQSSPRKTNSVEAV